MRGIARICGVSATTVSKALREDPIISKAQRLRIQEVARQFHYRPNLLVGGLMRGRTKTVGIIRAWVPGGQMGEINIGAMMDTLLDHGYCTLLFNTHDDVTREAKCIDLAIQNRVGGILIATTNFAANEAFFHELREFGIPFLFLSPYAEQVRVPHVHADDFTSGLVVTRHLLELGHRRIAHIGEPGAKVTTSPTFEGYKKALQEFGVPVDEGLVNFSDYSYKSGLATTRDLIETRGGDFTAIFACSYVIALAAIEALRAAGLRVPGDVSVAGRGTLKSWRKDQKDKVTTIDQKPEETGRIAATMLIDRIEGRIAPGDWSRQNSRLVQGELITGTTTARIQGQPHPVLSAPATGA
jgi:DNA-binding LacI/PurR family transcriptional regulator